ncbi:16S rRNA (guanine(966)-N(2))-methyltransferase RsmD [Hyphomicrobium methylovorum]|uniref:16S rRNA (guanine(966)-N(2))-methyltransferase RsmD n=1 Tax=Hyphomicrobium methylovorum TaxID=84 RepID=UPI0015E65EB7|nr:16S rRNA (guanine(966)-N(2))-methyltransferase RsmD [Hyphomicrobium methylovorum]MBA2126851.1 16S rRNA (guanine(966)-N(2))-methyltransferase RsmD [Hyphomicrobium methylovorum]
MRVVAGRFRGRALATPADSSTRPTSDRVRESVFNILSHGMGNFLLQGSRVIDLFAGTGALGIEAVSRGASFCLFVEDAAGARALIRENVEALGLTGETRIYRRDATDLGPAGNMQPYDLAFLDPPYGKGLGEAALTGLASGAWLRPGAVCVLEERLNTEILPPGAFTLVDRRAYGDTEIRFLQFSRN